MIFLAPGGIAFQSILNKVLFVITGLRVYLTDRTQDIAFYFSNLEC